jgi:enamine deaminase RidA (YjgF/YER057c/UK114 family)
MLKLHVLEQLYHHSSNVAHGVEVPAGARLLFTNGQVGTRPDGVTPGTTAEQTEVAFERLRAVLRAAGMGFADVVRFDVFFTDRADLPAFVAATASWARTSRARPSSWSRGWPGQS